MALSLSLHLAMKVFIHYSRENSESLYFVSLVRITISFTLIKSENLPYIPPCFNRESIEEWYKEEEKGRYKQEKKLQKCNIE